MKEQQELMNVKQLLSGICLQPEQTIEWLAREKPNYLLTVLAMIGGVQSSLYQSYNKDAGDKLPLTAVLLIAAIGGPLFGLIGMYLNSALLRWTGKWIGGQASAVEIRLAYAWSCVPQVLALPLWIVAVLAWKQALFSKLHNDGVSLLIEIAIMVLNLWGLVVFLRCLKTVQKFSIWRALLNLLLPILILLVPVLLIIFAVILLAKGF